MARKFTGTAEPLTQAGFKKALDVIGNCVPELMALASCESRGCGFLPDRRPMILFERHWFHKLTQGRFSAAHPDISNPSSGGYAGMAKEYPRIEAAAKLDRVAALKSASWGIGQVMGFNHLVAGFADVEAMVSAMMASEDAQLMAVTRFLKANRLDVALQNHDWATVARAYNGKDFAKNKYDLRLAGFYQQFASAALLPDIDVRTAQAYLSYLGYNAGGVDGLNGKRTRSAVVQFRQDNGLAGGERIDKGLLAVLRLKVAAL